MRIFSYIFSAFVFIFIVNIALSFSLPTYRQSIVDMRIKIFPKTDSNNGLVHEEVRTTENTRLIESLERLDKHMASLGEVRKTGTGEISTSSGATGSTTSLVPSHLTGSSLHEEELVMAESNIPLS
jgi:hypothetical protein